MGTHHLAEQGSSESLNAKEASLQRCMKDLDPGDAKLEKLLEEYRREWSNFLFLNYEEALRHDAEAHLWDLHTRFNGVFRAVLRKLRAEATYPNKNHVQRRKIEHKYLNFLKVSTRFYRGLVQRLVSHFSGSPQVLEIAELFGLKATSLDTPIPLAAELNPFLLKLCHNILIRLGDLSRYRAVEIPSATRNFGPARGYYEMASALDPSSGAPFSQIAVLALAEGDTFQVLYNLYRAVSVVEPVRAASGNLALHLSKSPARDETTSEDETLLRKLQRSCELLHYQLQVHGALDHSPDGALDFYLRLLVNYCGQDKSGDTMIVLRKISLMNIAAEHHGRNGIETSEPHQVVSPGKVTKKDVAHFQVLNLRTYAALLELMSKQPDNLNEGSRLTRTIVSSIYIYTLWFVSSATNTINTVGNTQSGDQFWELYTSMLNRCLKILSASAIPHNVIPEDEDLSNFAPLAEVLRRLPKSTHSTSHASKPKQTDQHGQRYEQKQHTALRAKKLVQQAFLLLRDMRADLPIIFADHRFHYVPAETSRNQEPSQDAEHLNGDHFAASARGIGVVPDVVCSDGDNLSSNLSSRHQASREHAIEVNSHPTKGQYQHVFGTPSQAASGQHAQSALEIWTSPAVHCASPSQSPEKLMERAVVPDLAPESSGAQAFEQTIAKHKEDILQRSSHDPTLQPTLPTSYGTPSGFESMYRSHPLLQQPISPPQHLGVVDNGTPVSYQVGQADSSGVGQHPLVSKTPTCAQNQQGPG